MSVHVDKRGSRIKWKHMHQCLLSLLIRQAHDESDVIARRCGINFVHRDLSCWMATHHDGPPSPFAVLGGASVVVGTMMTKVRRD